jgi:hypothetical protein
LCVADRGLREGMLLTLMTGDKAIQGAIQGAVQGAVQEAVQGAVGPGLASPRTTSP